MPAPQSRLSLKSYDLHTGNDEKFSYVIVPPLAIDEEVTVKIRTTVGAHTELLHCKFTANCDNLPEQYYDNNGGWQDWMVVSRGLDGNSSEKTGFSNDPVNTASGNLVHEHTDLSWNSRFSNLSFVRYYNSNDSTVSYVGCGWRHSFMYELDFTYFNETNAPVGLVYPDGHTDYWHDSGSGYEPHFPGVFGKFEKIGSDWRLTQKDLNRYTFDSSGKLVSIVDKNNNGLQFSYSGDQLIFITEPAGRVINITYSGNKLTSIQDWSGRHVDYLYSGDNLDTVTDLNKNLIQYGYDGENQLNQITDQRGIVVLQNIYDSVGRVISQTDGNGNITDFVYTETLDGTGQLDSYVTTISNPLDDTEIHIHNTQYQLIEIKDELNRSLYFSYDIVHGLRDSIIDKMGNITSFVYDLRGNVIKTTFPDLTKVTVTYNSNDLPLTEIDQMGHLTIWAYDGSGNVITETVGTSPDLRTRSWNYNSFGQKIQETDRNGKNTVYAYDGDGLLERIEDSDGVGIDYGYDNLWRLISESDDIGNTTLTSYNPDDTINQIVNTIGTVNYTYDNIGNKITEIDARGYTTSYQYDNNSNLTHIIHPDSLGVIQYKYDSLNQKSIEIDARGNPWNYSYYKDGKLHEETDPAGKITTYTYDANGNVLTTLDATSRSIINQYDKMNRLISVSDDLSNVIQYIYDDLGRKTEAIDANGNSSIYGYDEFDNLLVVTTGSSTTNYEYDNEGRLTTITDAEDSVTSLSYSDAGRLLKKKDPLLRETNFTYDVVGNLKTKSYSNGQSETYDYDAANRLIGIEYSDNTSVAYTLDANGNTNLMVDSAGTTNYSYDALNRIISTTDPFGKTVYYQYDQKWK